MIFKPYCISRGFFAWVAWPSVLLKLWALMMLLAGLQALYPITPGCLGSGTNGPQFTELAILPPWVPFMLPPPLKFAWLNRLKKSKRNWMRNRSPHTRQFLSTEKSVFTYPGPGQAPIIMTFLGMVPISYPISVAAPGLITCAPPVPALQLCP